MAPQSERVGIPDTVALRWDRGCRPLGLPRWPDGPEADQRGVGGWSGEKEEGQDNFGHQGWGPKLASASPGAHARNGIGL